MFLLIVIDSIYQLLID